MTRTIGVALLSALALNVSSPPSARAGEACYAHQFLGDKPDEANPGWHQEAQGLTHDSNYWYAAQNVEACVVPPGDPLCAFETPQGCVLPLIFCLSQGQTSCAHVRPGWLWKIHVTHDLSDQGASGVATVSEEICNQGFNHLGAPTHYVHEGTGFVLAPLEGNGPAVTAFRADTLASLGWSPLDPVNSGQSSGSWVAVDRYGTLWSGSHNESHLNRYAVDWDQLRDTGVLVVTFLNHVPMLDGGQPLALDSYEQGGAFADDPDLPFPLLYMVNGDADNDCDCGVHVFEIRDSTTGEGCTNALAPCAATRVDRSANGSGSFSYAYDPGFSTYEEPEGITFWDLDADTRAPGVSGQVHVVLLDNDEPLAGQGDDDVYVKHYRLETDSVAPAITCPPSITVECTGNCGIAANDPQLAPFFAGASATDQCDNNVAIASDAPSFFPLGGTLVTFTGTDDFKNASSCAATVTVQDTIDPVVSVQLDQGVLWPPNHKLVEITATVSVADVCDPHAGFVLTSITSSEPDDGLGDGDTTEDIQGAEFGTADSSFQLRAERAGMGPGRVYTIVFTGSDESGNTTEATAVVTVPHHQ
jgi:hypothetical protein